MPHRPDLDRLWFDPAEMLIGGVWRPASQTLPIGDPSTGAAIGALARGTAGDIDAAVAAAEAARRGDWGRMTAAERG
ncbi:aldehyde dehydrogenase family protein, partial [Albidovulum sp.]